VVDGGTEIAGSVAMSSGGSVDSGGVDGGAVGVVGGTAGAGGAAGSTGTKVRGSSCGIGASLVSGSAR
jgi:hypothetical protein